MTDGRLVEPKEVTVESLKPEQFVDHDSELEINYVAESDITRARVFLKEELSPRREAFFHRALSPLNELLSRHCQQTLSLAVVDGKSQLCLYQSFSGEPDELFEGDDRSFLLHSFASLLCFSWDIIDAFGQALNLMWQGNVPAESDVRKFEIALLEQIENFFKDDFLFH